MILDDKESILEFLRLKIQTLGYGGITATAKKANMSRENLIGKALAINANPTLDSLCRIARALDLRIHIAPRDDAKE